MTNNKSSNPFLKLSSAAIQMAAVIGGFTWLGTYLDTKWSMDSLFTIVGALLGVGIGLYLIIKEVNQLNRENPPQ
jgi:F0F1-type ATP synthase assembly protein I